MQAIDALANRELPAPVMKGHRVGAPHLLHHLPSPRELLELGFPTHPVCPPTKFARQRADWRRRSRPPGGDPPRPESFVRTGRAAGAPPTDTTLACPSYRAIRLASPAYTRAHRTPEESSFVAAHLPRRPAQSEKLEGVFRALRDPHGRPAPGGVGAEVLVASRAANALEGELTWNWTVVIRFPSEEAATAWYDSPEYAPLKTIRTQELTEGGSLALVPGIDGAG